MKRVVLLIMLIACFILASVTSYSAVIHVKTDGNDVNDGSSWELAKKTATAALTASVSGDEIWVAAGTYVERITLKDGVKLYGGFIGTETLLSQRNWKNNVTVLDGNAEWTVVTSLSGVTNTARIDGFTIRNGNAIGYYGSGIFCLSSSPIISNNIITNNNARYGGGISSIYSSPVIVNNIITSNGAMGGGGIYCCGPASPSIVNNTIAGNNAAIQGGGGILVEAASPTISSNIIAFNSTGISSIGNSSAILRNNCVYNPDGANYTSLAAGRDDISVDPKFVSYEYGQLHIRPNSSCKNKGCDADIMPGSSDIDGEARKHGSHVDIGADEFNGDYVEFTPRVIKVSPTGSDANDGSSWELAKKTVQAAIDDASTAGSDIWVAKGTYVERINLRSNTYLYGGFAGNETTLDQRDWLANTTILDGNAGGSVVTANAIGYRISRIDGFTIKNGKTSTIGGGINCQQCSPFITNNIITSNSAFGTGGISCYNSSPFISNNNITDNSSIDGAGGISCSYSFAVITNNTITGNNAGYSAGGIYCESSSASIVGNTISGNSASYFGGGIYCNTNSKSSSNTIISNNTIINNTAGNDGGGIYSYGPSLSTIANNTIKSNSANSGGGIYISNNSSSPQVLNNIIANNSAKNYGGGISFLSSGILSNNVVIANSTNYKGGGIYCGYSSSIINNTVTNNSNSGIYCANNSSPSISNNLIAYNFSGIAKDSYGSSTPTLRNNCVYNPGGNNYSGITAGTGDISFDPKLVSIEYGGIHIQPGSPCIDAGYDAAVNANSDFDGEARIQGSHVDIGADESDGTTWTYTPRVIRVSTTGNDANDGSSWELAKKTVQAAIDAASISGGDIWVAKGTYVERIKLRAYAHLYGGFAGNETALDQRDWKANATILDGSAGGSVVTIDNIGYHTSRIDGFTIRNGKATYGGGIFCYFSSPFIRNNTVIGNIATESGGGIYSDSPEITISNNIIMSNKADYFGSGVYCKSFGSLVSVISDNIISDNSGSKYGGGGIYCSNLLGIIYNNRIASNKGGGIYCNRGSLTIHDNVIMGNSTYGGIYCASSSPSIKSNTIVNNTSFGIYCDASSPSLSNNIITYNPSGILCYNNSAPALRNNCVYNPCGKNYFNLLAGIGDINEDPKFVACEYGQVHIQPDSPCIDAGYDDAVGVGSFDMDGEARVQGSQIDIGADESDGTTWTYTPRVIRVSTTGNDANDGSSWELAKKTVQAAIDAASISGADIWVAKGTYLERIKLKAYAHLFGGFAGDETALDQRDWKVNVTILDGSRGGSVVTADSIGERTSRVDGFTIKNGTGTSSSYASYGGGIHCIDSSPYVLNNNIMSSAATYGGGICCRYSSPVISNNIISGNGASVGAGIYYVSYRSSYLDVYASPVITNNIISGNSAGIYGGGIHCAAESQAFISGNLIRDNYSRNGAAIYCIDSSPCISNNTIVKNIGYAIYTYLNSSPAISNNVIAFNTSGIYCYNSVPALRNNCLYNPGGTEYYNLTAGIGDISVDPLFVDRAIGNYHLSFGSPCIDAGYDDVVGADWLDMDGEERIMGSHVDIGADEVSGQ